MSFDQLNLCSMSGDDWRTSSFRQKVLEQINDAIRSCPGANNNGLEMENKVFQISQTKDDYLSYVARVIIHIREMKTSSTGNPQLVAALNARTSLNTNQLLQAQLTGPPQQQQQQQLVQQLQTHQPGQTVLQAQLQAGTQSGLNHAGGLMQQQAQPNPQQQHIAVGSQGLQQMLSTGPRMQRMQHPKLRGAEPRGGIITSQMPHMPRHLLQHPKPDSLPVSNAPQLQRQGTPTAILQSPGTSMGAAHSPAQQIVNVASPAYNQSSPSAQVIHSPAQSALQRGVTSPGPASTSSLGTPGQAGGPVPSPGSGPPKSHNEEQMYMEKVKQLSKYIEPLKRLIAELQNSDPDKRSRITRFLDILSSPTRLVSMETLLKCEQVLERMDLIAPGDVPSGGVTLPSREQHVLYPLVEAVGHNLKSSLYNHTIERTLHPPLHCMFGPPIKCPSPPPKRKKVERSSNDISDILQGEIARLDQRFKVSLDASGHSGNHSIQLLCQLEDKNLPCVPPLHVTVPKNYPSTAPVLRNNSVEYDSTTFLQKVQMALKSRLDHLSGKYTVSVLLNTWEMAVRQACSTHVGHNLGMAM